MDQIPQWTKDSQQLSLHPQHIQTSPSPKKTVWGSPHCLTLSYHTTTTTTTYSLSTTSHSLPHCVPHHYKTHRSVVVWREGKFRWPLISRFCASTCVTASLSRERNWTSVSQFPVLQDDTKACCLPQFAPSAFEAREYHHGIPSLHFSLSGTATHHCSDNDTWK